MALSVEPVVKRYALHNLLPSKLVRVTYKSDIILCSVAIAHKTLQ
jgi:hypothetical protein